MDFLTFRNKMLDLMCFSTHQIYAWQPQFDRNNLTNWIKKRLLVRLKRGLYTFSELSNKPEVILFFANRIYRPSYISLHSALAFYGMIPEAVIQINSVTSLKTSSFVNQFGSFTYQSVRPELMFGYELKPIADGRAVQIATPEKALLDLLYLYSFYNNSEEIEQLRLDEDFMSRDFNWSLCDEYAARFQSKVIIQRVKFLKKLYKI